LRYKNNSLIIVEQNNVCPFTEQLISREVKEQKLGQRAKVIWFTGLPCSGKSTLAIALEKALFSKGYVCQVLDGDNVRTGINNNLRFSNEDRIENIRRIAEISKLYLSTGVITINAFVSPTDEIRNLAKGIIGENDFIEIFINSSLSVCEKRDVKGMYKKARAGKITDFTGITAPFEVPEKPTLEVHTDIEDIETSLQNILNTVLPILSLNK